jgi:uncharacterized protein YbaR (Trm112 family)
MPLAPEVLAMLRCPASKGALLYFASGESGTDPDAAFLLCPASRLRYRFDGEVAVLMPEEAERLEPDEVERLVRRAKQLGIAGV